MGKKRYSAAAGAVLLLIVLPIEAVRELRWRCGK